MPLPIRIFFVGLATVVFWLCLGAVPLEKEALITFFRFIVIVISITFGSLGLASWIEGALGRRRVTRLQKAEKRRASEAQQHKAERQREADAQQREAEQRREEKTRREQDATDKAAGRSKQWWEVLGVTSDATLEEITQRYRDAIRLYHPDRVNGLAPEIVRIAEKRTKELNVAYAEARRLRR